ncbi:30S ribosomal protein S6, partial [bacterium]
MPKYEMMYIVGSSVSDDEIPKISEEIKKYVQATGGLLEKHEEPGKKKLAYPIKKTRYGYYILDQFSLPSEKISEVESRVRAHPAIIRHLVINIDEDLIRLQKDTALQAKFKIVRPKEDPA